MKTASYNFTSILASPTDTAWSQTYNAGNLFVLLALASQEKSDLTSLGQKTIKTLQGEYFTLEKKDLSSIKQAIKETLTDIPPDIIPSLLVVTVVENILYALSKGEGEILLKREDKLGTILKGEEDTLVSASGFIKPLDTIALATRSFLDIVKKESLETMLSGQKLSEVAETLLPKIHKQDNGGASALFFTIPEPEITSIPLDDTEETQSPVSEEKNLAVVKQPLTERLRRLVNEALITIKKHDRSSLNQLFRKRPVIIGGAAILLLLLFLVTHSRSNQQAQNQLEQKFESIYTPAKNKYDQGVAVELLNGSLAKDDFRQAQQILTPHQNDFPQGSKEQKQISDLLKKIQNQLSLIPTNSTQRSNINVFVENGSGTPGVAGKMADELKALGYTIKGTGNADNYSYQGVTLKAKTNDEKDLVKQDLSKDRAITSATTSLPSSSPEDVLVIVGK